ncbi:MAG TPA: hypothetical protein VHD33_04040, partial [Legionellaceae bacterium]|nr:hypothetical protein [Legionellaceae bacterium]
MQKRKAHDDIKTRYKAMIEDCFEDFCLALEQNTCVVERGKTSLWDYFPVSSNERSEQNDLCAYEDLPLIFKTGFDSKKITSFLVINKDKLLAHATIFQRYPIIMQRILMVKIEQEFAAILAKQGGSFSEEEWAHRKKSCYDLIRYFYADNHFPALLQEWIAIETFIINLAEFSVEQAYCTFLSILDPIIKRSKHIKHVSVLLEVLLYLRQTDPLYGSDTNEEEDIFYDALEDIPEPHPASVNSEAKRVCVMTALQELNHASPALLEYQEHSKELLILILKIYLQQSRTDLLLPLLSTATVCLQFDAEQASALLSKLLSYLSVGNQPLPFFLNGQLNGQQLSKLADILASKRLSLSLLNWVWIENPHTDFTEVYALVDHIEVDQAEEMTKILEYLRDQYPLSIPDILKRLSSFSPLILRQLVTLIEIHQVDIPQIVTLMNSEDIEQKIAELERMIYRRHLERFTVDIVHLRKKIAEIRVKSITEGEADRPLSPKEQKEIEKDYLCMMSYMLTHPVLAETDNAGKKHLFTIVDLSEVQCQTLYRLLKVKLMAPNVNQAQKHAYRLLLLALSCEAMYRCCKKFPNNAQLLCHVFVLRHNHFQIQEVKTGGGKSLISEIVSIMLPAEGWTVDMTTENNELADVALQKFKRLYQYLDVP